MKNTGKQFEEQTEQVFKLLCEMESGSEVSRDVQLKGIDGPRQIDVLLRSTVAGLGIITIVECRDFGSRLSVTHIDALHSKMLDVQANKAVLVSKRGFSGTARKKAARLGITLCTLNNPMSELGNIGKELPIAYVETQIQSLRIKGRFTTASSGTVKATALSKLNDIDVSELILQSFRNGEINVPSVSCRITWEPKSVPRPLFLRDLAGGVHEINDYVADIEMLVGTYFGYSSAVTADLLENKSDDNCHVFITANELEVIRDRLAQYDSIESIPKVPFMLIINKMLHPTIDISKSNFKVNKLDNSEMWSFGNTSS